MKSYGKNNDFNIFFRVPIYPAIIISRERLYSGYNDKQLAVCCINSNPAEEGREIVQVIDMEAEEFWYVPGQNALSPGFASTKWTKKKIIELFNNSTNADYLKLNYPLKFLSSKRLGKIVYDICDILKGSGSILSEMDDLETDFLEKRWVVQSSQNIDRKFEVELSFR